MSINQVSSSPSSTTRTTTMVVDGNNNSSSSNAWLVNDKPNDMTAIIPISNDIYELEKQKVRFVCEKCRGSEYRLGEVRSCGSLMAKIFNVQNRRFITVTCTTCGHTQFFESTQSALANILDILIR